MLGVASRFSVLKIEGEENPRNPNKKKPEKPKPDAKKLNSTNKANPGKKKPGPHPQNGQVCWKLFLLCSWTVCKFWPGHLFSLVLYLTVHAIYIQHFTSPPILKAWSCHSPKVFFLIVAFDWIPTTLVFVRLCILHLFLVSSCLDTELPLLSLCRLLTQRIKPKPREK